MTQVTISGEHMFLNNGSKYVLRLIPSISAILVLVNPMEISWFTSAKSSSTLDLPAALVLLESGNSAIFTKTCAHHLLSLVSL